MLRSFNKFRKPLVQYVAEFLEMLSGSRVIGPIDSSTSDFLQEAFDRGYFLTASVHAQPGQTAIIGHVRYISSTPARTVGAIVSLTATDTGEIIPQAPTIVPNAKPGYFLTFTVPPRSAYSVVLSSIGISPLEGTVMIDNEVQHGRRGQNGELIFDLSVVTSPEALVFKTPEGLEIYVMLVPDR